MNRRRTEGGEKWTDLTCSSSFFTSSPSPPDPAFFGFLSRDSSASSEKGRRETKEGGGGGGGREEKSSNYKCTLLEPKGKLTKVKVHHGKSSLSHKDTVTLHMTKNAKNI